MSPRILLTIECSFVDETLITPKLRVVSETSDLHVVVAVGTQVAVPDSSVC